LKRARTAVAETAPVESRRVAYSIAARALSRSSVAITSPMPP
jgi:hypothetical protein